MAKAGSAKGRRLHAQAVARREAAAAAVPDVCDVLVVGAGASGLAAALAAAATPQLSVVVLDGADQAGKPILATGNGRCNLSNEDLAPSHYNDPTFVSAVMGSEPERQVQELFGRLGLLMTEEEGRIYPRSRCASSVQGALLNGAAERGAVVGTLRPVVSIDAGRDGWRVTYEERFREQGNGWAARTIVARALVLAPGAPSPLADQLGLPSAPFSPVLCPVAVDSPLPAEWDGHRDQCRLTLVRNGRTVVSERGEALFRPGCVSGIAAMNLSRHAEPGDVLSIDLVPDVDLEQVLESIRGRLPKDRAAHLLDPVVDPVIGATLVREVGPDPVALARVLHGLELPVTGLAHAAHAQVQRGGVLTSAVDPATLEVIGRPGLHLCGEALNVDGACGGYNLAFAWLSGLRAGQSAAASLSH